MGCSGSKQKKDAKCIDKIEQIDEILSNSSVKPKKLSKPKQTKSQSTKLPEVDNAANHLNDIKENVQRSISPPPTHKKSKITRKTWTDEELLCQLKFLDRDTSSNIVHLFDEGNTIPFICRYRRDLIGNRDADE